MKKYILILVLSALFACKKQEEWLDEKINRGSLVPSRLADYSALLDGELLITAYGYLGITSTDHLLLSSTDYNAVSISTERNGYTWAKDVYEGRDVNEWSNFYRMISVANVCLEGLEKIPVTGSNEQERKRIQGTALFYRALGLYQLLQFFASPYNPASADTDLGVPIRLSSDVNARPVRSSVKDCYARVVEDLTTAVALLPQVSSFKTRPSLAAAQALFSKVYLMLQQWQSAEQYAAMALGTNPVLLDFNTLNATAALPMPNLQAGHPEVIFYAEASGSNYYSSNRPVFDTVLYKTYATNDLRKTVFFRIVNNLPIFKAAYTAKSLVPFAGIATNEIYLIRAEALARSGQKDAAMTLLNTLLSKRWKTGTYVNMVAADADDALRKIIIERRKELPWTGSIVWEDLRRLNRDSRFARTLTRTLNGVTYTLPPNDPRYTLPIPDLEIRLTGIPQNIR